MSQAARKRGRAPLPETALADARSVLQASDEALLEGLRNLVRLGVAARKDIHAALELLDAAA